MSKQSVQRGTTLAVIAVAAIAILAAIALPAYRDHVRFANMAKVQSRYEEAARVVIKEMRKDKSRVVTGSIGSLPADTAAWVAVLSPSSVFSPGGDPAYKAGFLSGADDVSGVVGVVAANAGRTVTLTRPDYEDFSGQATWTVAYVDL